MKTLYVHIGTPKTATSSLQDFCWMNRQHFHKLGFAFPLMAPIHPGAPILRNAHFLVDSSPRYGADGLLEKANDDDPKKQPIRQKNLEHGLSMVHKAFQKDDNVILTDESLWISLCYNQKNPLDILCEDAKKEHYRIRVIVYLRRQDQYLISRWNQFVKNSSSTQTFQEYLDEVLLRWPLIADYAEAVDDIAKKIGKENVIVRRFEPSSWKDGSIYADFLDALGLDLDASFKQPKQETNTGLTLNYAEIQRQLNLNADIPAKQKEFLGYCLRKASDSGSKHAEYGLFSTSETKEFLAGYEEGNTRIAREYLGVDGPLFPSAIKETGKWEPQNEYMGEDLSFYLSLVARTSSGTDKWKYHCKKLSKSIVRGLAARL
ncbi:MAG: hypothetical protein LUI14_09150 [Lachnospiraceae bacterium]|nr:hypothetical protein [Lachnospiraceae bacterium]